MHAFPAQPRVAPTEIKLRALQELTIPLTQVYQQPISDAHPCLDIMVTRRQGEFLFYI